MKRFVFCLFLILFANPLVSCSQPTQTPTTAVEMIAPGEKIGDVTVTQGIYPSKYPLVWEYCEFLLDGTEPGSFSSDCSVPTTPALALSFGWAAEEPKFEASWNATSIELYFDGYKLDLEKFNWEDMDSPEMGPNVKSRYIVLYLENLTPGEHTYRVLNVLEMPVDTGLQIEQPGVYEHILHFTVADPEVYPILSSIVSTGQHRYRSEEAGLDYLLYVPDDYGIDSQKEWPLILYLHGLDKGVMNSMELLEDALSIHPENWGDFPFIIISPQGKGEYEFWSTDEMVRALMTLLDEIQDSVAVDSNRIYLTGYSAGGNGTWEIGLGYPDRFAALAPAAGYYGYPFEVPENICYLQDVPVWAFHGADDEIVPLDAEEMLVDALEACGGDVQLTVYADAGHDIEDQVYATPELYDWLLAQTLE